MSKLKVERVGGFAGFGGNSHLKSIGEIDTEQLSTEDKKVVEDLFVSRAKGQGASGDSFRFKITRVTSNGTEVIEAGEGHVPDAVKACVRDEIV